MGRRAHTDRSGGGVRRRRRVVGLIAVAASVSLLFVPSPASAGPTITLTPDTDLVDGQVVEVVGTGFDPLQRLEIFQCRAAPVDENDCDTNVAFEFDADAAGVATFFLQIDARIYVGPDQQEVDCRTAPGACVVGLGYVLDADEGLLAPLDFDPDAPLRPPVSMSVTPTDGLVDGQVLTVDGSHLTDREESWVYQCKAGAPVSGATCDFGLPDVRGVADADGNLVLEWPAKATLYPPAGGTIDCTAAPHACEVVLSWSFSGPPDRVARTPISFATAAPPSTSSTVDRLDDRPGTRPRFTG